MKYRITRRLGKALLEKLGQTESPSEGQIVDLTEKQAELLGANAEPVKETKKPEPKPKPENKPEPKPQN